MLQRRSDLSHIDEVMRLVTMKKMTSSSSSSHELLLALSDFCSYLVISRGPLIAAASTFEKEVKMVHLHENVTAVSFFDDNRIIVGFDTGRVRVYDVSLSRVLYEFKIRSAPVLRIKRVPRTILCKDTQHHQHEEIWYLHEDRVVVAHTSKALDMEMGRSHHRRDEEEVIDHNSWELRSDQQNIQDFSVRGVRAWCSSVMFERDVREC